MRTVIKHDGTPADDPVAECAEAKQIRDLIVEMIEELRGMQFFAEFLQEMLLDCQFSHRQVARYMEYVRKRERDMATSAYKLRAMYDQLIADYEHEVGPVEYKKLPAMSIFATSFAEIASRKDRRALKKDLLGR